MSGIFFLIQHILVVNGTESNPLSMNVVELWWTRRNVSDKRKWNCTTCRWWKSRAKVAGSLRRDRSQRESLWWSTLVTLLSLVLLSNERWTTRWTSTSAATCTTSNTRREATGIRSSLAHSSVIFVTKIKTRTRIIGRRFQRTRTRIIAIQKNKTK